MRLEDFFKETYKVLLAEQQKQNFGFGITMMDNRPRIICNDGFSMSVQGSIHNYCEPREYVEWYESLEIGFPSDDISLKDYCDDSDIYGYVPVEMIQDIIDKHSGIDVFKTLSEEKWNSITLLVTDSHIFIN